VRRWRPTPITRTEARSSSGFWENCSRCRKVAYRWRLPQSAWMPSRLPETVSADTGGGGRHLFFKHPAIRVRNDSRGKLLGAGIDVLSDGKIAIVAPSRHASGKRYAWQAGKEPGDIAIAQLPTPWLKRLTGNARHEQPTATSSTSEQQITEGGRNKHLISVAGALQRIGASRKAISAAVKAENLTKCSPPPRRV
jgi:putative DNA primase/helicase